MSDIDQENPLLQSALAGCLLGTAVGDAIGLPMEGMSRRRGARVFPDPGRYHFIFGKGFCSDDTEHACMSAQALVSALSRPPQERTAAFRSSLAWRMRFWLLGFPAGVGLATGRGIIKLWLGFPARNAGVYSAGNGPAMRAPVLGVACGEDENLLRELVRASTRLTHTDPKAEQAALAAALAARHAATRREIDPEAYLSNIDAALGHEGIELLGLLRAAQASAARGESTQQFAASIGCEKGVSGYAFHTLPVVIHAWFAHPRDFRQAVLAVVGCGGDTDTGAAILGGIVGAGVGEEGIPIPWREGLAEWPRSQSWIRRLAIRLASVKSGAAGKPLWLNPLFLLLRNLVFLAVVLGHGFRRLLPPY